MAVIFFLALVGILSVVLRRKCITAKLPIVTEPEYAVVSDIVAAKAEAYAEYQMDVNSCYATAKVEEKNKNFYEEIDKKKGNDAYGHYIK